MFAKLVKHEWRGCRQVLVILCAITLGAGLLVGLSGVYLTWTEGQGSYFLAICLLFLAALAIGICAAGGFLYLVWRFYQSRFTDEGYLTFTLPVGNHQQLLAAILNILRGTALVFAATVGAFALMGLTYILAFFPRDVNWGEFFQAVWRYLPEFWEMIVWREWLQVLLYGLVLLVSQIIVLMTSVTVGAVLARKHKLLTGVAVYYGISLLQTWGLFFFGFSSSFREGLHSILPSHLVTIAAGYLLMHWLTKRKLNLT